MSDKAATILAMAPSNSVDGRGELTAVLAGAAAAGTHADAEVTLLAAAASNCCCWFACTLGLASAGVPTLVPAAVSWL